MSVSEYSDDKLSRFLSQESKVLRGVRRVVNVPQPAAGANWTIAVPGGVMWRLLGGQATLTTSAAVANRQPGITLICQGQRVYANENTVNITAGNSVTVTYQPGTTLFPSAPTFGYVVVPFVPIWMEGGDTIATQTVGIDVADQYSKIALLVEEAYFTNQELSEWRAEREAAIEHLLTGGL